MENQNHQEQLKRIEQLIKAAHELRQQALTKKGMYEEQLKEKEKEMKELGTSPDKMEADIENLEKEIESDMQMIQSMIPMDLLREFGMIK